MSPSLPHRLRSRRVTRLTAAAASVALLGGLAGTAPAQAESNPVTPGDFRGFGFDQCDAPSQATMDRWLVASPFMAAGIYISGESRACREQRNLTPTWVANQLQKGWRLQPITLGPQASCSTRFPRYGTDETIDPAPGNGSYRAARLQGRNEAVSAMAAASKLGIPRGSTLWYDLEGFDHTKRDCRESALAFLSAWTAKLRSAGWVSGVYSSAGSGIVMLDDARKQGRKDINLPDYLWIARWDGVPNTSTSYISEDGWNPHRRVKQYKGGHNETWGGATINIDSNFLDVGRGMWIGKEPAHCGGVNINWREYHPLRKGSVLPNRVKTLQCLLTEKRYYTGPINGKVTADTIKSWRAWQRTHARPDSATWSAGDWMSLLTAGRSRVLKYGVSSPAVRALQRGLNAAGVAQLDIDGKFTSRTGAAVRRWQANTGQRKDAVISLADWKELRAGRM